MNKDEKNKDLENIVAGALAEWVLRKMYNTDQSVLVAKRVIEAGYRKVADDDIVIKKNEYKELKKYRTDWLNSEKMHLQAELEDTEFELGRSNRLFQKVCEEKKELEKQLEQVKQETAREIFYKLKETLIINNEENTEWFDYDFTLETINELANKYGIELEG